MASAKSNILKAIGGAGTGVASVEAASNIPSETLDKLVAQNPLGYLAAEAAVLGGGAKAAEKFSQTKAAEALKQKLLKKAGIKAGTAAAGSLISGPFAPAVGLGAAGYGIYDLLTSLDADDRKLILDLIKPKASAKRRKQRAKVKSGRKPKFRQTKKEILKSVGRKTGGKVSRPKGVGCAVKGYGKAMTRD
tara:strand:+ start:861 stop:1433 length:573 start_codon:yes stop_codon:yes gene_type:complete